MRPSDVLELVRGQPFAPFRIHATDGRTYDVRHPDQIMVLRSRAVLGVPERDDDVPDRTEHLALVHISRIEELSS
jgi:hypothetical protein